MKAKTLYLLIGALCLASQALAADPNYPVRPIEYVVPAAAGGDTDMFARVIAPYMTKKLGQPVMVVNKSGGGTIVGAAYVLKQQKADGYTVLADIHTSYTMLIAGMANAPVGLDDREDISRVAIYHLAYAVHADAPWKTFKELGEWVKTNPEKLTWGSVGPSAISAFAVYDWLLSIGADPTKTRMVPTQGGSDSIKKMAGGHIVLSIQGVGEFYPLWKAGKIRVLAVQADQRSPYMLDVPVPQEQGIKLHNIIKWSALTMRKGTPASIISTWEKGLAEMVQDPTFKEKVESLQGHIAYLSAKDMRKFALEEIKYYTKLANRVGIRK
jgi:tripartite-type tricarboxylate transporter receptor subunit TctC